MRILLKTCATAAAAVTLTACAVQGGDSVEGGDYPQRTVEFTVPYEPGGSTDLIARVLAKSLEAPLGAQTIVVNKPGANGKIAGKDVFSSKPDGYRVAVMPQSLFAVGPLVLDDPDAIQLDDMTFIKGLTVEDYVMVVPSDSPIKSVEDLKQDGNVKYGTAGAGTGGQLSQALLLGLQKVKGAPVPFDGAGPLLTAVLGGKVDTGALHIGEAYKQVEAGALRPLAVFSEERHDALPTVPTAKELGYDVLVDQRKFVVGPAGIPDEVRDTLAAAIDKSVQSPEYTDALDTNYIGSWDADGDAVGEQLRTTRDQLKAMTKRLGIDLAGQS